MPNAQPAIAPPTPLYARYLTFVARSENGRATVERVARLLEAKVTAGRAVVGFSASLLDAAGHRVSGHTSFPDFSFGERVVPRTQGDVWVWLRDEDRPSLLAETEEIARELGDSFSLAENVEAFTYAGGRDLTGYEDGTENPKGEKLESAAFVAEGAARGASFVAIQRWEHALSAFASLPKEERDAIIGREKDSNEELEDAPESAHVKRTAQESFEPEAFLLRRSMPWIEGGSGGLYFVAFGSSFYAFDVQMRRMTGESDGIADVLFRVSKPLTGGYYYCPPLEGGAFVFPGT